MSTNVISSLQNPRVKAAAGLRESKERRRTGLFAVEGAREIERALVSGLAPIEIFYCDERLSSLARAVIEKATTGSMSKTALVAVSSSVIQKLLLREDSDGLYAIFKVQANSLSDLKLSKTPLLLAVEALEKPGNLGALLRTADGCGCDAVIVLGQSVDAFNPQVIRASLGTVFNVPVISTNNEDFVAYCQANGLTIHAAALTDQSQPYHTADLTKPTVILLGSEAHGLSEYWLKAAAHLVKIPMRGIADSLNVATAGAVLVYEALRQRT